jgi:phenylacetate-CoA ligase
MNLGIIFNLFSALKQMRKHEHWTGQQLATYQDSALQRLRAYAYAHSPFYGEFHQGLADRPLHELPVLTKAMMMEHFDTFVTDRTIHRLDVEAHVQHIHGDERFLGRYWVTTTSGSTGRPGLFLFDRAEWTAILASFARAHELAGLKINLTQRRKMAFVASSGSTHMSARAGVTLQSWWTPTLRLAASEPVETIVQQLNDWQPEILVSYASMAGVLADEQLAGRLRIHPHVVFTSSEVLTDEARRRVTAAWGQPPFNQYAATETGSIAAECTWHTGMHLFEDLVIVEVVDQQNQPVLPGVCGDKLLVTTLFSRTQPLIRYELTDRLRLAAEPCPSGRPFALIDSVEGRMEDVLQLPATGGGAVTVHPLVFHRVMDTAPVSGWQIVQEADGLTVLLSGVRDGFIDTALAETLRQALIAQGALAPPITVRRVSAIPQSASGKVPLIKANPSPSLKEPS